MHAALRTGILMIAPLVLLGTGGVTATTIPAPVYSPPECVVAAAWVAAHMRDLPTTEAGLSGFSMIYRRAIFRALPVEVQRELWREHLTSFLESESPLTATQRAMVREAVAGLDGFFDPTVDRADRQQAADAFMQRVSSAFPNALRVAVFSRLGPEPQQTRTLAVMLDRTARAPSYLNARQLTRALTPAISAVSSADAIVCECNVSYQDCPGEECFDGPEMCSQTEEGCGPMWLAACDGTCSALAATRRLSRVF